MLYVVLLILSVFAVPGIYFLFIEILSLCQKETPYFLLISGDGLSDEALLTAIQSAVLYIEGRKQFKKTPFVLFTEEPSSEKQIFLAEYGIPSCVVSPRRYGGL